MADATPKPAAKPAATPTMTKIHRAVHELRTGPGTDDKIEAGALLTAAVLESHHFDPKTVEQLVKSGAIGFVEVLKG